MGLEYKTVYSQWPEFKILMEWLFFFKEIVLFIFNTYLAREVVSQGEAYPLHLERSPHSEIPTAKLVVVGN